MDQELSPPTVKEFYTNPSGIGITANNIGMVKREFIRRYDAVTKSAGKKVHTTIYMENENSFYFHMLIPSDMNANTYDVVLHVFDNFNTGSGNLKDWNINFFSNCPSFVFTYAVAYNESGLLIPFLTKRFDNKVLHLLPEVKNPDLTLGWDKSIFYALHAFMTNITFTQRFVVKRNSKPLVPKELFDLIRTQEQISDDAEIGKTTEVRVIRRNESALTKVKNAVTDTVKRGASKAIQPITHSKQNKHEVINGLSQPSSSASRFKVNLGVKGKIIGATKIGGSHRSRKRK